MSTLTDVVTAFREETAIMQELLLSLEDGQWTAATPAPGWSVLDQVAHLTFVYDLAATACEQPEFFKAFASGVGPTQFADAIADGLRRFGGTPAETLAGWMATRDRVAAALEAVTSGHVPWLVNPLPPDVLTMAGMLETFAHGQDVADAVGVQLRRTDHAAYLVGFIARTRDFGFHSHELPAPTEDFRFEAVLPSGARTVVGPADATQVITGPATDIALLASRRRHRDDLQVKAVGDDAERWLAVAQAYRGPAGAGRRPGQFAVAGAPA